MSENTPMRRRRPPQPVQIDDASIPHKSDEDNPVRPAREMPPHRRVRVVPIETTDDDAPRHLPESPLSSLPTPVRFGALALALILLIVGSVSITRTYLAHQEERRRLEAEAAERAQHHATTPTRLPPTPMLRSLTPRSSPRSSSANQAMTPRQKAGWAHAG